DESRPLTVAEALDRYEADLKARGGDPYNARHARLHLPGSILSKPVALLGATELRKWRDSLLDKGLAAGTVNRTTAGGTGTRGGARPAHHKPAGLASGPRCSAGRPSRPQCHPR